MPSPSERTDDRWLRDLRASDARHDEACAALRAVLLRGLRRGLAGRGVDAAHLEDFAQEGLLRVLERLDSYRGDARFTTWATAVALRVAFTELRRARWKDRSLDAIGADDWPASAVPSAAGDLEKQELVATLQRVIDDTLTPRQRTAVLAKLEGVPQITLAADLDTNPNALYKMQHDARRRLRKGILAAGFSEADVRRILDRASEE